MSKVVWKESRSVHAEAMHVSRKLLTKSEHGFCVHFYPKKRLCVYICVHVCVYAYIQLHQSKIFSILLSCINLYIVSHHHMYFIKNSRFPCPLGKHILVYFLSNGLQSIHSSLLFRSRESKSKIFLNVFMHSICNCF